jgi:hypothetical protein
MQNPGVLWFMIKQWQIGDQIQDYNRGELRSHPEGSGAGFLKSPDENCPSRPMLGIRSATGISSRVIVSHEEIARYRGERGKAAE